MRYEFPWEVGLFHGDPLADLGWGGSATLLIITTYSLCDNIEIIEFVKINLNHKMIVLNLT
jgi:hypothetical protein